jgi:hypothetical protein
MGMGHMNAAIVLHPDDLPRLLKAAQHKTVSIEKSAQ